MWPAPKRGALPTALWLLRSGFWPVVISARSDPLAGGPGKSPVGRGWGVRRATRDGLISTFARHTGAGVGIALGPAAGILDIEVDDPVAAAPVLERLGLAPTLGWESARGSHRIFSWDERLGAVTDKAVVYLAGGAVELRLGAVGKQLVAVCPPTVGTDRKRRRWNGVWELAPFPERVLVEIERGTAASAARERGPPADSGTAGPYAAAALRAEASLVREAREGTRNRTLNRAAFNLGQLVGAGLIARATVEAELAAAAAEAGLPERETAATIRSGLEAGISKPRARNVNARGSRRE